MIDWSIAVPSFLIALAEWVEAFTIVLAVSLSIGWQAAVGASLARLATLTAAAGRLLATGIDIGWVQLVVGVFLMLFGVRWLAKAPQAGLKALLDEAVEFEQTRARLTGEWAAGWMIAYKGVLLEGLEVWLVVVALGMRTADGAVMASSAPGLPLLRTGLYSSAASRSTRPGPPAQRPRAARARCPRSKAPVVPAASMRLQVGAGVAVARDAGRAALAAHGGEAREQWAGVADPAEQLGARTLADVVRDGGGAVAASLGA